MSEGIPYADIVILALIAGFILLRLRSILGRDSGTDYSNYFKHKEEPKPRAEQEPVVHMAERILKPKPKEETDSYLGQMGDGAVKDALAAIKARDPVFSATEFLTGAKMAYEMVFDAFAKDDKQTLKMLLSDGIYKEFENEIDTRAKQENKTETTLVAVISREIVEASLHGSMARITVKFVSEQVAVVRDKDGKIVEGDPSQIDRVEDQWVFERDVTSKNPNWKIIET